MDKLNFRMVANLSADEPLKRWDPDIPGTTGTGFFAIWGNTSFATMLDADGNPADFYVDGPCWLETGGNIFMKHRALPVSPSIAGNPSGAYGPANDDYPIYTNARIRLVGPAATQGALPALNWSVPAPATQIWLDGWNIDGPRQHYSNINLATKYRIAGAGFYRLEVWCGSGSSVDPSRDGLGAIVPFNSPLTTQFWGRVYT
ncbi:MAG: hypothetical protein J0H53_02835 [Rhizobiales bacterium]|nr:hypothetical protein [Hyphomicrobiales bacterium]